MTKEKLNCFPHDKFNPHYAARTHKWLLIAMVMMMIMTMTENIELSIVRIFDGMPLLIFTTGQV